MLKKNTVAAGDSGYCFLVMSLPLPWLHAAGPVWLECHLAECLTTLLTTE